MKRSKSSREHSIGRKIALIVSLFTLLTVSVAIEGQLLMRSVLHASKDSYRAAKADEYIGQISAQTNAFLYLAFSTTHKSATSPAEKLKYRDDLEIALGGIDENILGLSGQTTDLPEIEPSVRQIESNWKTIKEKSEAWIKLLDSGANPSALARELHGIEDLMIKELDALAKVLSKSSSIVSEAFVKTDHADKVSFWISIVVAFLIVGIFVFSLIASRQITRRCNQLIAQIHQKSLSLLSSSVTLSTGSQKLSESSTEQAAAIQESMSAMEEMGSMIQNTTQYTEECNRITGKVEAKTREGVQVMRDMVSAMESIEESNLSLSQISTIIEKIFERTNVINDIVFKTQLLSFNASIEAARAGQYGKGFAVVAEEVGKLAESSGAAAKEISQLLAESRREVGKIVGDTTHRVQEGKAVSHNAMEAFEGIANEINSISEQVVDISRAAKEQTIGVQQVGQAMREMDKASLQNNSVAHDVAKLSQTIKVDCDDFTQIINSFRSVILGSQNLTQRENVADHQTERPRTMAQAPTQAAVQSGSSELSSLIDVIAANARDQNGQGDAKTDERSDAHEPVKKSA